MEMINTEDTQFFTNTIQLAFQGIEQSKIKQYSLTLFPIANSSNTYQSFNHALTTYFSLQIKKQTDVVVIAKELLAKSQDQGVQFKQALTKLLQGQFLEKIKNKTAKFQNFEKQKKQKEERKTDIVIDITKNPPKPNKEGSLKSGANNGNKVIEIKKNHANSDIDYVNNLGERGICLCEKEVKQKDLSVLHCIHCKRSYHLECMKKKLGSTHCALCHLKKMLPNKQTKKVLFMGQLKKGKKRHEFSINLTEEDLNNRYKIQVRCFRLKQTTQQTVLFPDYTHLSCNNSVIKQMTPLHRQSSLKYRKDQPFYIQHRNLQIRQNKIVVLEKLPSKQLKQQRIEPQNHLIGFFLVEEKKVQTMIKEFMISSINSFEESKNILEMAFRTGSQDCEDVICEVVKIPLTCSLTSQKLKYPSRGIFCTHFTCFDLQNYLMMISNSVNPRWICSICKQPCYQFKIDCIVSAILNQYEKYAATEVMFFKTGEFTVQSGEKLVKDRVSNIYDLPIDTIGKRAPEPLVLPQKKKKKAVIPQDSQVISLDE